MGNVNNIKRLRTEDFSPDDQELVSKLCLVLNPMIDQLLIIFNKGIDFKNLNMQLSTLSVTVDSSGAPTQPTAINSTLKSKCSGLVVIRCLNTNGTNTTFSSAPLISFTESNAVLNINSISGLTANQQYSLTVLCVGGDI